MNCPKCGKPMRAGFVKASHSGSLVQLFTQVLWYPEEYEGKLIKEEYIPLQLKADGYYCDECKVVSAEFEETW